MPLTEDEISNLNVFAEDDHPTEIHALIIGKVFGEQEVDEETDKKIRWRLIEKHSITVEENNIDFSLLTPETRLLYYNLTYEKLTDWVVDLLNEQRLLGKQNL